MLFSNLMYRTSTLTLQSRLLMFLKVYRYGNCRAHNNTINEKAKQTLEILLRSEESNKGLPKL
jgi:hypothetical protein